MPLNEKYPRFEKQMITYILSQLNRDTEDFLGIEVEEETFYEREGVILNKSHTLLLCPRTTGAFYDEELNTKTGKSIFSIDLIENGFFILGILDQKDYIEIVSEPDKYCPIIIRKGMFELHIPPIDKDKPGGKKEYQSHILNGEDLKLFPPEDLIKDQKEENKQEDEDNGNS